MVDIRINPAVLSRRRLTADNAGPFEACGTRDGAMYTYEGFQSWVDEGRVFSASNGSIFTALTATNYTVNRPQAWIRVPSGTAIIPLSCTFTLVTGAGTTNLILLEACGNDIGNGTSTAATLGPSSFKVCSSAPVTSNCTVRHLASADTTVMTAGTVVELYTDQDVAALSNGVAYFKYEPFYPPLLVGPASIMWFIQYTTTAPTFKCHWVWAELPSTMFT